MNFVLLKTIHEYYINVLKFLALTVGSIAWQNRIRILKL